KEVHHRVKNNLQIISSLLNLQAKSIKDPFSREKFEDTQNRVRSMALVHEKLYESKESSKINFSGYIKDFMEAVSRSYNISEDKITVHTDIRVDNSYLKIDTAIPCALILNELISNCFKHAFSNRKKGNIYMYLNRSTDNEYIIRVADDGVGISDTINIKETSSLGLQLIAMLVEQINGDLTILSQKGTMFVVKFKSE
ncbi:MAG: sensor histidine kinase, partial [Bacteroidota bacterium]